MTLNVSDSIFSVPFHTRKATNMYCFLTIYMVVLLQLTGIANQETNTFECREKISNVARIFCEIIISILVQG
jgi:hypothetical protein